MGSQFPAWGKARLIHLAACHDFEELQRLMDRFNVQRCVIDGLPETHATREFTTRNRPRVLMNFFNEHQRGAARIDYTANTIVVNRTEALDASRRVIRDEQVALPRRTVLVEQFAKHMVADAKVLDEDEETGIKKFRYIRTGEDHFSLAFTYAWLALENRPAVFSERAVLKGQGRSGRVDCKSWIA